MQILFSPPPQLFKDINDSVLVVAEWKNEGFVSKKMDTLFNKYTLNQSLVPGTGISNDGTMFIAVGGGDMYKVTGRLDSIWLHPFSEYEISWGAGTSQNVTKIKPTSDGGYAFIGDTWNGIVDNIYLIKTDAMGNQQFSEMYWSVTNHNIDVVQANDGGYVMMNIDNINNPRNIWIVKTDQNGIIGIDENNFFKSDVILYPNPTKNNITLKFNSPITAKISIFNIAGQLVLIDETNNTNIYKTSVTSFPSGIYFIKIKTKNNIITKKLVVSN